MKIKDFDNGPLPETLRSFAYTSPGGNEFGLPREASLEYLTWCDHIGLSILGFDVWIPTTPKPIEYFEANCEGDSAVCRQVLTLFDESGIIKKFGCAPIFNIWTEFKKKDA